MSQRLFYSTKSTGTYADALAAFGLAEMLKGVVSGRAWSGERTWLRDDGPYYVVELPKPLPDDWSEQCEYFNPAKPISTPKQRWKGKLKARDYDAEWKHFKQYQETAKTLRDAARKAGVQADLPDPPSPDFWVLAFLGDYRMQALNGYNEAIRQWEQTRKFFIQNMQAILQLSETPYPDVEAISKAWGKSVKQEGVKRELTASQLFNPHQGKGQNRPKADALAMGNESSFWLLEYLKGVGLWKCGVPRTVRGGNDRKTYVVSPKRISLGAHEDVFVKFGAALWNETAVKMDIFSALQYAQTLIDYGQAKRHIEGRTPDKVIAGLYVTTYKLLSQNAYTTMNLAFIGIPEWIGEISTRAGARSAQEVIKEHLQVIAGIDEERSDGYQLLERYRDFLSACQLPAFFGFSGGYAQYYTSAVESGDFRARSFTVPNLRRLFVATNPMLTEIIDNEGFQSVATAIRLSTVRPQYQKARAKQGKGEMPLYEVRYGLGQELKRCAPYAAEFIAALASFMQSYNQENAQKLETERKKFRKDITKGDIDQVVRLVMTFGSELVANLLLAYGYARDVKEDDENEQK